MEVKLGAHLISSLLNLLTLALVEMKLGQNAYDIVSMVHDNHTFDLLV